MEFQDQLRLYRIKKTKKSQQNMFLTSVLLSASIDSHGLCSRLQVPLDLTLLVLDLPLNDPRWVWIISLTFFQGVLFFPWNDTIKWIMNLNKAGYLVITSRVSELLFITVSPSKDRLLRESSSFARESHLESLLDESLLLPEILKKLVIDSKWFSLLKRKRVYWRKWFLGQVLSYLSL